MASHVELNPDDNVLGLSLGMKAMRLALTQKTHKVGTVRIPTGGDTDVIIGDGAQDGANRIDQDGNQLPLVDTSEIEQGVQQAQKDADAAAAKADEVIKQGEQIRQDAQAGIDDARKQAQTAADKADKVRSDLQAEVEANRKATDTAIAAVDVKADKAQSAADAAQKAADKANASTADLDKTVQAVDAKAAAAKQAAAEAQSKAENVASDLDSANAVIERHTTELGELTTKVSNAVTKADSALSVSTEAKQTATEASTTASSAYKDSQTALTQSTSATQTATAAKTTAESASKTATDSLKQSSSAVQTANQISTTLKTEYQTKADADKLYATQSSLKQTSDSITASVSKTYATKDALTALQNVADNAIESWRGTGVPTLTNKPASDWTTDTEKKKHSGDLYYDKATGKAYRFGSDDGKTYTWELNQDSDVAKALSDASKAQTSANNAQTSANAANTAAGKAQTTANTAANNAATAKNAADAAQSSANKAQGDVDKLKIDIPETYATKSSLTQTAESITANVESVKSTANSAVTAASNAQQTADGISANLTKNYQTKAQADTIYATKASLKATSDSISAEVTKAQGTADGAVTAASKAQQTADAVTLNLSKNYNTKAQNDAMYATQTSLKATSDSLSTNITANAKTAQSAVDKATSLEANLNGFKTTVSDTYMAKGIGDEIIENGIPNPDRPNKFGLEIVDGVFQRTFPGRENHVDYGPSEIMHTIKSHRTIRISIDVRLVSGKDTISDTDYVNVLGTNVRWVAIQIYLKDIVDGEWHSYEKYLNTENDTVTHAFASSFVGSDGVKVLQFRNASIKDVTSDYKSYSTKSELTQAANSIKAQVTEVSKTANGAMSKATTVEQTANGLSTRITEQAKTLDATVKTANEAKSTADSNKTTISQTSNLVNAALAGDNLITDGGFESTAWWMGLKAPFRLSNGSFYHGAHVLVCEAATGDNRCPLTHAKGMAGTATAITVTKGRTYRLSGYCAWYGSVPSNVNPGGDKLRLVKPDGTYIAAAQCGKSTSWSETHVDWTCPPDGSITSVRIEVMHQANGTILWDDVSFQDITEAAATSTRVASVEQNLNGFKTSVADTYQPKSGMGGYATQSQLTQTANQIRGEVSEKYQSKDGMGSYATNSALTQKANEITGKVQEVAKTAQGNTTTISQVSQKADRINTTLSQKIDGKADVSRVSSLEQNLSGFKTTVAQSYQPKGDYPTKTEMQSNISQSASSIKSEVANTYTTQTATEALRKSATRTFTLTGANGKAKWVKLGYLTSNGDSSSVLLHVYSGDGYNGQARQNAEFEIFVKDGWQQSPSATGAFGVSVSRIRNADGVKVKVMAFGSTTCDIWAYMPWAYWNGHYTLQGDYESWQDGPNCGGTRIQDEEPTNGTAQNLDYDTISTRSYVDQTAKSVALGVVQSYKGSDGSGLATKSDITAAKTSITSSVSSTYATKTGVTQEISSKITQNNSSLDVKFATKTENKAAQDTADKAKSNASDAQSRVGALEDCIGFTSSGVRAGHQQNGVFNGVSALVNTDGSFDLLDKDGNLLTRINQHRFQVTGDDGTGSGYLSLSQDGINITVQPTADASKTYHIQVGKSGVGITAPDGSSIECSASGGLNIETVKYGKIAIGSGGLQFTNDQGWGLELSAAGWSIKWAGNHTLATGPKAGALYIDGHEIVTR